MVKTNLREKIFQNRTLKRQQTFALNTLFIFSGHLLCFVETLTVDVLVFIGHFPSSIYCGSGQQTLFRNTDEYNDCSEETCSGEIVAEIVLWKLLNSRKKTGENTICFRKKGVNYQKHQV